MQPMAWTLVSGFCELLEAFVSSGYRRNTVERTEKLLCGGTTDWFMDPGEVPFWGLPEGTGGQFKEPESLFLHGTLQ